MAYCGYVTNLKNLREHPKADRLMLAECFGNTVCVAKGLYQNEQVVVYFPVGGQLSLPFCEANNLIEKKDENGKNIGGYLHPRKRNIKAIQLRGIPSDGIALDLKCLEFTGADLTQFAVGDSITVVNGIEICQKYIPYEAPKTSAGGGGARAQRRAKRSIAPIFYEHADTGQLAYNLHNFKAGDHITITRKLHGTSQRTGYTKVLKGYDHKNIFYKKVLNYLKNKQNLRPILLKLWNQAMEKAIPVYEWDYVCGTRRTVLTATSDGYYGNDDFRMKHHNFFKGKLLKGETVYYEVVGFLDNGTPIMPSANNKSLKNKELVKKYGDTTVFSYGCSPTGYEQITVEKERISVVDGKAVSKMEKVPILKAVPKSKLYVYRMTMTNEDGDVVEYTPYQVARRCGQMGAEIVPLEWEGVVPEGLEVTSYSTNENNHKEFYDIEDTAGEWVKNKAEEFYDGPEPIDPSHVREGVVVRIVNRDNFTAYKHKNFDFKLVSGIAIEQAEENGNTENVDSDVLAEM